MVKTISALIYFCYLVRRNAISTPDLTSITNALKRFHQYRKIFFECGVRVDISLPRQHSLVHYPRFIRLFGPSKSPGGYKALPQMLVTLSRLDKLAAAKCEFTSRGSSYTAMVLVGYQPLYRRLLISPPTTTKMTTMV
ncbi:hypothetical protein GGX14DRAFT_580339 [Mycena pura]|uniref:Uncharacterized protein n=1 Tax=Mycena pura TaxID=153505 RepID=A0AAD6UP47_9AGAR|nr:hypothetical protein GGX14DRAFT_580339 [Mycena pura]